MQALYQLVGGDARLLNITIFLLSLKTVMFGSSNTVMRAGIAGGVMQKHANKGPDC